METPALKKTDFKVLIIEDDPVTRIALCGILRAMNCKILSAEDGVTGVELFMKEKPDVVMTDILMPHKEGLETITEIRAADPHARIVAMSGGGTTRNMSFLDMAKKAGAAFSVQKPFTPAQIRQVFRSMQGLTP